MSIDNAINLMDVLIIALFGGGGAGVGTWAAIRVEIKWLKHGIEKAHETAKEAHRRIDNLKGHR